MSHNPERAALHYAVGVFAGNLAGQDSDADLAAAVAKVPAGQMADYEALTLQVLGRYQGPAPDPEAEGGQ